MQQLLSTWAALTPLRRAVAAGAALAAFLLVLLLSRMVTAPDFALLYAGLEPAAAGEVVAALEAQGVVHEVRGGAIYVDSAARDTLRLSLAASGLPATGGAGYELLDGLSGFGTTAQMFDAAYWRAKEGELARTLAASPAVRSARVHIATPPAGSFRRDLAPSASVALVPRGSGISADQARAVRHLVASAVAGLRPEDVSVIDAASGLVLGIDDAATVGPDRAAELRGNVERILRARVGPGRAVVEVSVETVTEREQIVERRLDPEGRVAISQESEERSSQSTDERPGAVTVASNLPEGDGAAGGQSSARDAETRQRVNYELSETSREVLREPGALRRITVAVMVDGITTEGEDGPQWQPRPEEELQALRDLIASAVGYDESRGDVVTIRSLPFEPLAEAGTGSGGGFWPGLDPMALAQAGILALVILILGLFVVRPILAPRRLPLRFEGPDSPAALSAPAAAAPALRGPVLEGEIETPAGAAPPGLRGLPAVAPEEPAPPEDPVVRLRRMIAERRTETAEILRTWMDDPGEATR